MALLAKAAVTYTLLAGTSRPIRIIGTLLLVVDLATVPRPVQVHCPSHEDGPTRDDTLNLVNV